jgi:SET domain
MTVELRTSDIAGHGLFTDAPIPGGAVVEVDPDRLNHSCDPSLAWGGAGSVLLALRDLAAGEELTIDYATSTTEPSMLLRCHCETYRCRQLVTGDDWLIPEVQRRYAGHFAPQVQRCIDAQPRHP